MRETAVAWSWFDVEVARHLPEKQHPDVRCRQCGELLRNAQLGRTVLPHAGYKCGSATTTMVDTARRLMYEANVRKADAGSRVARAKLAMGEGGEPGYIKRNRRKYPWLPGHGGESDDEQDDEEEKEDVPPPVKKRRAVPARQAKPKAASRTAQEKPAQPTAVTAQLEVEFSAQAMDENSGAGFMLAEAFHSLGVPLETLDNSIFRSILKILNPNVTLPSRDELTQVLSK